MINQSEATDYLKEQLSLNEESHITQANEDSSILQDYDSKNFSEHHRKNVL